jgi:hypothetical protein
MSSPPDLPAYFNADDENSLRIRAALSSPDRRRRQGFSLPSPDLSPSQPSPWGLPQSAVVEETQSRAQAYEVLTGEEMAASSASQPPLDSLLTPLDHEIISAVLADTKSCAFPSSNMSQENEAPAPRRPVKASTSIPVEWRLSTISEESFSDAVPLPSAQPTSSIPSSSSPAALRPSWETTSSSSGAPELADVIKSAKTGRKTRVSLSIHKMGKRLFSSSSAREPEAPFGQSALEATDAMLEALPAGIEKIDIDVFHPVAFDPDSIDEEGNDAVEALVTLSPLSSFRNLKYLKITGMLDSFQSAIWLTAFLNPGLKYLHLEMALAPELAPADEKKELVSTWRVIDGEWKAQSTTTSPSDAPPRLPKHSGTRNGDGVLHTDIGYGEYLDTLSMLHARNKASTILSPNVKVSAGQLKLRIEHLHLRNFVVDGLPFSSAFDFFNADYLRWIEFGEGCVDAGFVLPGRMDKVVSVGFPSDVRPAEQGSDGVEEEIEGMGKGKGKDVDRGDAREGDANADELGNEGAGEAGEAGEIGMDKEKEDCQECKDRKTGHRLHRARAVWMGNGSGVVARGPATVVMVDKKGKTKRVVGRDPWERMIG